MKRMKHKLSIVGSLILLIMVFSLFAPLSVYAQETTLVIHYHRFDKAYEGWNIWAWPKDGDGNAYYFTNADDFGPYTEIKLDETISSIGIRVRLNEWEKNDIENDRYIDLNRESDGSLHIYLVQGDETIYYDKNDVDLSPQFLSASFVSASEIEFTVTESVNASAEGEAAHYSVIDDKGVTYSIVKIQSKEEGETDSASVILEESLDLGKRYTLERDGYGSIPISVGAAFSTSDFEAAYTYEGDDLGAVYSKTSTTFRVYAPTASEVSLNLYSNGLDGDKLSETPMNKDAYGTWTVTIDGDLNGTYYTYTAVTSLGANEAVDPYAKAVGVNGKRGMVIDLDTTDPEGWEEDKKPEFIQMTDAIVYELHIRDLSSDASSGIVNIGKFLELTETETKNRSGLSTGIDHMKELGITHLHLLPSFDYASVDETMLDTPQFNWGYDPVNYNVPEGSYSTDPYHGEVRIKEMKQAVQSLHKDGIRVVMDVVYNHTAATADSNFNKLVPDYYYRKNESGFSNGSACGNEIASDHAMVRKFIVDSVVYWAEEYHIDGFRFDLMALHDIETMNEVRKALDAIDPTILIYGEGWKGGESTLPEEEQALKINVSQMEGIAVFSDDLRDGIKGSVFDAKDKGFVSGAMGLEETIKFGVVAATNHPQVNYEMVNYSDAPWAKSPDQCINYASAHDNLTLWDKLASSNPEDSETDRIKMNKLSASIILTSQGIPFFQAGEEILRTKTEEDNSFVENSYQSSDFVNRIQWDNKTEYEDVFNYYKGLIAFRKEHPSFRLTDTKDIAANLVFEENAPAGVVAYSITGKPNGETADGIYVIHNANKEAVSMMLPAGVWKVYVNGEQAGTEPITTIKGDSKGTEVWVDPISSLVLVQEQNSSLNIGFLIGVGVILGILFGIGILIFRKNKKKS